jgi:hypothetical protein
LPGLWDEGVQDWEELETTNLEGYKITSHAIIPIAETRMSPRRGLKMFERSYQAGLITRRLFEETRELAGPKHIPNAALYLATDDPRILTDRLSALRGDDLPCIHGMWTADELRKRALTLASQLSRARG